MHAASKQIVLFRAQVLPPGVTVIEFGNSGKTRRGSMQIEPKGLGIGAVPSGKVSLELSAVMRQADSHSAAVVDASFETLLQGACEPSQ